VLAGKHGMGTRGHIDRSRRAREDKKSCHVTAVLDRAASDRTLKPLPLTLGVVGSDGRTLNLIVGGAKSGKTVGGPLSGAKI
jgi:hypothetical protein